MLPLAVILPIAVVCAIIFLLLTGATLCWLRYRRDQRSQFTNAHSSFSEIPSPTYLPREEGSALQPNNYGQLPYEHSVLQENLVEPSGVTELKTISRLFRKWWSRYSFWPGFLSDVIPRSKQKCQSIVQHRPTYFGPSDASVESSHMTSSAKDSPCSSCSRKDSRVEESALELSPVETTGKPTSENDNYMASGNLPKNRPASAPLPLPPQGECWDPTGFTENRSLTPNPSPTPVWGSNIANQTAGDMPSQQIPASPPTSCIPSRFYYSSKDDSATGLSSMSLATADSAILDDGVMRASSSMDRNFTTSDPSLAVSNNSYDVARNERDQTSSTAFNATLPTPAAFQVLPFSDPQIASLPHAVSRSLRQSVNASGRPQVNPLQLNPVHQRHSMFELSPMADYERQFDTAAVSESFSVSAQRTARTYSRESLLRASEGFTGTAPLLSPETSGRPFRKGHKRQHSVRLPLMPAGILRATPSSSHIEDTNESDEQNMYVSSKGKSRVMNQNHDSDDVFVSSTKGSKLVSWDFPIMKPKDNDPYQRQRAEMSGPGLSPRRNMNTRTHRISPVRSFKSPSMMTIWEDDRDIPEPPIRTSVAASQVFSGGLEQGNLSSHGSASPTDEAQIERSDQTADFPETPSVRIVQDSDTVTPTDKPVGLGLAMDGSTPGSLYDKDGFLKE